MPSKKKEIDLDSRRRRREWVLVSYIVFLLLAAMWAQSLFIKATVEAYNSTVGDDWLFPLSPRGYSVLLSFGCAIVGLGVLFFGVALSFCVYYAMCDVNQEGDEEKSMNVVEDEDEEQNYYYYQCCSDGGKNKEEEGGKGSGSEFMCFKV